MGTEYSTKLHFSRTITSRGQFTLVNEAGDQIFQFSRLMPLVQERSVNAKGEDKPMPGSNHHIDLISIKLMKILDYSRRASKYRVFLRSECLTTHWY